MWTSCSHISTARGPMWTSCCVTWNAQLNYTWPDMNFLLCNTEILIRLLMHLACICGVLVYWKRNYYAAVKINRILNNRESAISMHLWCYQQDVDIEHWINMCTQLVCVAINRMLISLSNNVNTGSMQYDGILYQPRVCTTGHFSRAFVVGGYIIIYICPYASGNK